MRLVQTPHAGNMPRHPLFRLEARRIAWGWPPQRLRVYSWRILWRTHFVLFTLWLAILGLTVVVNGADITRRMIYADSLGFIQFLVLATIAADAILDFRCLQAALTSISGEMAAGRWDLLRLSSLSEVGIVRAKHAGIRLRMWRSTMIVVSARAAAVSLSLVAALMLPYLMLGENVVVDALLEALIFDPFGSVLTLVIGLLTVVVYVVEPFWRMEAMTSLGMMLSAYIGHVPLATLAAVGAMFAVWLIQTVIVLVLVLGLGVAMFALMAPVAFAASGMLVGAVYTLFSGAITAVTIYGFYSLLQTWSLRRVVQRIDKAN